MAFTVLYETCLQESTGLINFRGVGTPLRGVNNNFENKEKKANKKPKKRNNEVTVKKLNPLYVYLYFG